MRSQTLPTIHSDSHGTVAARLLPRVWASIGMVFAAIGEGLTLQRRHQALTSGGLPSSRALTQALTEMEEIAAKS